LTTILWWSRDPPQNKRKGKEGNRIINVLTSVLNPPPASPSLYPSHKHNATARRQLSAKFHLLGSLSYLNALKLPNQHKIINTKTRHNMDPAGGQLTTLRNHHHCIYLTSHTRIPPPESCSQTHRAMPHSSAIWVLQTLAPPFGHQSARNKEQKNREKNWNHDGTRSMGDSAMLGNGIGSYVRLEQTDRCDVMWCDVRSWNPRCVIRSPRLRGRRRCRCGERQKLEVEDGWFYFYIRLESFQNVEFHPPFENRKV
jgi:hypothetical protein